MNLKEYFGNKISILKCWIKEYFLLKNSLEHLGNFTKKYYVFSIGFDDIYHGNKNMKRFKICIVNWVFNWFIMLYLLALVLSDKMFSLIDVLPIFGKNLKLFWLLGALCSFFSAVVRTDYLYGEINYNLNPFKVIYYLMKDLKQLHKLNEKNYKKLSILSRSIQILHLDCGIILLVTPFSLFIIKIAILSGEIYWIWGSIILILGIIVNMTCISSANCLYIIMLSYYTMIFGQINHKISLILNEKSTFLKRRNLIINKTKERQLISLIREHNLQQLKFTKLI